MRYGNQADLMTPMGQLVHQKTSTNSGACPCGAASQAGVSHAFTTTLAHTNSKYFKYINVQKAANGRDSPRLVART
jgi:hypothetical protein